MSPVLAAALAVENCAAATCDNEDEKDVRITALLVLLLGEQRGSEHYAGPLTLKARCRLLASVITSSPPAAAVATPAFGSGYTCIHM